MGGKLIPFREIMTDELPPLVWTVEGLIEAPAKAIFYGEWGSLKTWLLLDLALSIAAGRAWLGKFAIPQTRPVLYLNEEDSECRIIRRLKRLAAGAGIDNADLPLAVLCRAGWRFNKPEDAESLLTWTRANKFDAEVIIAEPMIALHDGDENTSRDIRNFWEGVAPFYDAGKTLIISHHMAKPKLNGSGDVRHRAAGSRDILAGVDDAIAITRNGNDGLILETVKTRDANEPPRFLVTFCAEGQDGPVSFAFEGSEEGAGPGKVALAMRLAVQAVAESQTGSAEASAIKTRLEASGVPTRTIEAALTALVKRGELVRPTRGIYALPVALKLAA